jgi:hypothetical protein
MCLVSSTETEERVSIHTFVPQMFQPQDGLCGEHQPNRSQTDVWVGPFSQPTQGVCFAV